MPGPIDQFFAKDSIKFILTDIDDTLTNHGQLGSESYEALWKLKKIGYEVIPITGRPAGWCELIARMWPVSGVVGENGGFWFRYHNGSMKRGYSLPIDEFKANNKKLDIIRQKILAEIPEAGIASDQFCRQMDLAIDFCEDVPKLSADKIKRIVEIFTEHGAQAKVSSIHVNGWFGSYNKLSCTLDFFKSEFNLGENQVKDQSIFFGDSPNDEPMFEFFKHSVGVANIQNFLPQMKHHPKYITTKDGGLGFSEAVEIFIQKNP